MRTLGPSLMGAVILVLLAGLSSAVLSQDVAEDPIGVQVTVLQECA